MNRHRLYYKNSFWFLSFAVMIFQVFLVQASGQTNNKWYIDKDATGSSNGTNWTNGWTSFSGINWNIIQPGDTIFISGGTSSKVYNEELSISKSGTNGNNIVITKGTSQGHNGEVIIDRQGAGSYGVDFGSTQYVKIENLSIRNSTSRNIYLRTSNITVSNCSLLISSGATCGIDIRGSNNIIEYNYAETATSGGQLDFVQCTSGGNHIFRYNTIIIKNTDGSAHCDGLQFYSPFTDGMTMQIYGNYIFQDNTKTTNAQGIYIEGLSAGAMDNTDWVIYNNVLNLPYAKNGITIRNNNARALIYNNTIYQGSSVESAGFWIQDDNNTSIDNIVVKNNIFYSTSASVSPVNIVETMETGCEVTNNIIYSPMSSPIRYTGSLRSLATWNSYSFVGTDVTGNPNFTNTSAQDFSLQVGSPAIDAGTTLSAPYNVDILGVSRPQGAGYDLGAYEYASGGGGTNNPPSQPTSANPANGSTGQAINLTLTWSCTDPDGNPLTYDVYFGTSSNPTLVASNRTNANYTPGQLNNNTAYYWKIVAKDNQGATTTGSVWNFNTETGGGGGDITPPELVSANLMNEITVELQFSEPIQPSSADNPQNFSISNGVQVNSSTLLISGDRIRLITTSHQPNQNYSITASNILDLSGNLININANTQSYTSGSFSGELLELPIVGVDASSTNDPDYPPEKTIDGLGINQDPNSRWATIPMPQYLIFDLGQSKEISETKFSFYGFDFGRIYIFSVFVSDDSINWQPILQNENSVLEEWTINNIVPTNARFIKLLFISSNQAGPNQEWAHLWEAKVLGPSNTTDNNENNNSVDNFELGQNYPNPFNPSTMIRVSIPKSTLIRLTVYNILGEFIAELANGQYNAGVHEFNFNASGLASGIYIYRIESSDFIETKKMMVMK